MIPGTAIPASTALDVVILALSAVVGGLGVAAIAFTWWDRRG